MTRLAQGLILRYAGMRYHEKVGEMSDGYGLIQALWHGMACFCPHTYMVENNERCAGRSFETRCLLVSTRLYYTISIMRASVLLSVAGALLRIHQSASARRPTPASEATDSWSFKRHPTLYHISQRRCHVSILHMGPASSAGPGFYQAKSAITE